MFNVSFLVSPQSNDLKLNDPTFNESIRTSDSGNNLESEVLYHKLNVGEDQQQWVRYASRISGNDLDFLATLEAENGLWSPDRQSNVYDGVGPNGREDSYGFCQFHRNWHKDKVDDPRFFSDPQWQLDQCYEAYKGGTTFYGFYHRKKHFNKFELKQI